MSALGGTLGAANVSVNAADTNGDTQNQVSNGEVKIYAQQAAGNTVNGGTSNNNGSDTDEGITNNQTPAQTGNQGSTKNNGTSQTVTGGTMANVIFSAQQFKSYTDSDGKVHNAPTDASDSGFTGTKTTATSDANGLADFTGLTDGYWKFSQVTTVNGITTVKDFIVYVNHSDGEAGTVNVYLKLDMSKSAGLGDVATTDAKGIGSVKDPNAISAPNSTDGVSDQTLTNSAGNDGNHGNVNGDTQDGTWSNTNTDNKNTTTAAAGNTVNWNVNSVFDSSQTSGDTSATTAGSYQIIDKLPTNLVDTTNTAAKTVVNVTDGSGKKITTLPSSDYTVDVADDGTVTVTLNTQGQLDAAKALNGADGAINVVLPTTVKDGAVGSASDSATTKITNAYGADLSTSEAVGSTLNVGALDFVKQDATSKAALKGAEFVLVRADSQEDAQALVKANESYFNNATPTGNPTTLSNDNAEFVMQTASAINTGNNANGNATGKTIALATTDSNGIASFTGLNLVDLDTSSATSAVDGTDKGATGTYFAVEVKAPTGYQLPSADTGANVFGAETAITTALNGDGTTDENVITNTKPFALPFTGGEGLAGIVIIANAAGLAAFAIRKKKDSEEENA